MDWSSIFKGILPEALLKVDNRKINVTKTSINFGDITITDPKHMDLFFKRLSEFKKEESLPFQILHKDLENDYLDTEEVSIKQKESLKLLRKVLPQAEIECILMARRVHLAFEKNDKVLLGSLMEQLDKNYPEKGRKVHNLISAGYFDELILPMVQMYKTNNNDCSQDFQKFYYDILTFFPIAIFVNNQTTIKKIEYEISKRLKLKRVPFIKIHAMGLDNINKVDEAIKIFDNDSRININNNNNNKFVLPALDLKCQIVELKLQKNTF